MLPARRARFGRNEWSPVGGSDAVDRAPFHNRGDPENAGERFQYSRAHCPGQAGGVEP
jgi:hypothetical protein